MGICSNFTIYLLCDKSYHIAERDKSTLYCKKKKKKEKLITF